MTARATANAVTTWRARVGVEVMGGEYIADENRRTAARRQSACRRPRQGATGTINYSEFVTPAGRHRAIACRLRHVLGFRARTSPQVSRHRTPVTFGRRCIPGR